MKNNPYVGLRPYTRDERDDFHGRAVEARTLLSLALANRVVYFYAPPGAGKTSLLNARIIPELEEERFNVLPTTQVGYPLPPGVDRDSVKNLFVFSALAGLAGADIPPQYLTQLTLPMFLRQLIGTMAVRAGPPSDYEATLAMTGRHPPILIVDQFEQIFTMHRDRWQDVAVFFSQLKDALFTMPELGVVLALREAYLARLDPYDNVLPRRLRARFRMERLTVPEALEAIKMPAKRAGCEFAPGVAERLVDELRRIRIDRPDGEGESGGGSEAVLGPHIEPAQLQSVCARLWDRLPDRKHDPIQWAEVEALSDVRSASRDFGSLRDER